jgi:transcriptional regulator with XRE-family HTH domain
VPATCCRLTRGTERSTAVPPPPSPPAGGTGPVRPPRSHLAPVLACLGRAAGLTPRALAERLGLCPAEVSDILSGERFPAWPLTERFARVCGADPMVLRKVWQDEKLREHLPRPPAAGVLGVAAAERQGAMDPPTPCEQAAERSGHDR